MMDAVIPYTLNPLPPLPFHALRTYRYRCTCCRRSFDFMLRPATMTSWLPEVGASPQACPGCQSKRCMRLVNKANVRRKK